MKTNLSENAVLMRQARESLAGKWDIAIGTAAVYGLLSIISSSVKGPGMLISLLVSGPLSVGLATFALSISRSKEARLEQIFSGFKNYSRSLAAYLLIFVFTLLWMLLFIIPGIIAAISYSLTYFILVDDETIGAHDALKKSKMMMYGYKWKCFRLGFRFLGWAILSVLTLGIGFLWLIPYVHVTMAKFYEEVKAASEPSVE